MILLEESTILWTDYAGTGIGFLSFIVAIIGVIYTKKTYDKTESIDKTVRNKTDQAIVVNALNAKYDSISEGLDKCCDMIRHIADDSNQSYDSETAQIAAMKISDLQFYAKILEADDIDKGDNKKVNEAMQLCIDVLLNENKCKERHEELSKALIIIKTYLNSKGDRYGKSYNQRIPK